MSTVLARRIIAVSPDEAFGQHLAAGLAAAGTVDVHRTLDALGTGELPALCVIHLDGELASRAGELLPRLAGGGPVIAVIPRSDLAAVVELLQASDRVAGVMVAEGFDPRQLSAMAARILTDELCELESLMAPGTPIHAGIVGDYQARSRCMSRIAEFVVEAQVPRKYRAPIEQCIDEMVMNALYDAPVDAEGNPLFAGIPTRARIKMRTEQSVVVRYACDGKQLAVSVRDAFGTLERSTVLGHLHKCLHAAQPIERKAGGAGLGLYLMVNASTAVSFHVLPGVATQALCRFDLEAPKLVLEQLDFVQLDAGGRRRTASRRLPAGPRLRAQIVAVMMVAVVVLLGLLAGHALRRRRAGGEATPAVPAAPVATLELDSQPTGAAVEIDGRPMGSTPVTLTSLAPGTAVSIVFKRTGYRAATARLEIPAAGARKRVVQPLEVSDELVRVRFVSNPPGAEIREDGQPASIDHTYTPADVFVEANRVQRFTLTMPRHVPLVIAPFTPGRGDRVLEKGGDLVEGATLRIEATLDGKVTVSGAPHCTKVALPLDCTLAPGTYDVAYLGPDGARITRTITMAARDAIEKFQLGIIEAAPGKLLQPGGSRRAVLEAGPQVVEVSDQTGAGTHQAAVNVRPGATVIAN
jgi:hypothetical protein